MKKGSDPACIVNNQICPRYSEPNEQIGSLIVRVRWTVPAVTALGGIQDYIANENPRAAFEIVQQLWIAVCQLEVHPKLGWSGRVRGTYELVIHDLPYVVPYRIKKEEVQILSMYHASRKWPETFN